MIRGQHCQTGEAFQELLKDQVALFRSEFSIGRWKLLKANLRAMFQPETRAGFGSLASSGARALACARRGQKLRERWL